MKNIFKILNLVLVVILIHGCEGPLEDDLDKIKAEMPKTTSDLVFEDDFVIEFTDDDYAFYADYTSEEDASVADNSMFIDIAQAKRLIPDYLAGTYPNHKGASSAVVTFKTDLGLEEVKAYIDADEHEFSDSDYALIGSGPGAAKFLNTTVDVDEAIQDVLEANYTSAADGDLVAVSYDFLDYSYDELSITHHSEWFETNIDGYTAQDVSGAQSWYWDDFSSDTFAKMSGYDDGSNANEDWLVSPAIDLSGVTGDVTLYLTQILNYLGSGVVGTAVDVKISTDYTNDATTATWTSLTLSAWPAGTGWSAVDGTADLNAYRGSTVYLGFKYESTTDYSPTWEIVSVQVIEGDPTKQVPDAEERSVYYQYDGSDWETQEDDVYMLGSADYDAMGAPGRYNNFSSSVPPGGYLPAFLTGKFPFAQEGDELTVMYKFYNGSTVTRGDIYTFTGGAWTMTKATVQFGYKDTEWEADNTIKYVFGDADYTTIQGIEGGDRGDNVAQFNSFYQGSNTGGGTWWSDPEILDVLILFCNQQFASAAEGQKYLVSYDVYVGGGAYEHRSTHFIKQGGSYVLFE